MISCQKCEFKILPKMRFSLIKNFCPSCGGSLLSDLDSQEINIINKKLQSQEFFVSLSNQLSKDLIQNLIYDLSIFIKFDLQKEMGRDSISSSALSSLESLESDEEIEPEEEEDRRPRAIPAKRIARTSGGTTETTSPRIQNLRRMMEPEESEYDEDEEDLSEEDEDESTDERVKRLKQLYKTSPTLKRFGGITRSDEG
jgi:Zn-finger nucleic acid-binding protein